VTEPFAWTKSDAPIVIGGMTGRGKSAAYRAVFERILREHNGWVLFSPSKGSATGR
jgi:hypothetical protein